jgi:hypothetical protein
VETTQERVATPTLRTVRATRYVAPLREGGSVPAIVEADDDGLYVVKLRGAAQGPRTLIAELVAGEVGRALDLPVPDLVLVELDSLLARGEPDPELQQPLEASAGLNLGIDFLPGALAFGHHAGRDLDPELAAAIVWFDALVTNPDRTAHNPNLLLWHRKLYLIDHGAALYAQHVWQPGADPAANAGTPFARIAEHILLPFAGSIAAIDGALTERLRPATIEAIVAQIPASWLPFDPVDPATGRSAYATYLQHRLREPRRWVEEADRARAGR